MTSLCFENKNILVAGANGFVGINLLHKLSDTGANLFGTIHSKRSFQTSGEVTLRECDLSTSAGCDEATKDIDYVFMCAANSSGAGVMEKTPLVHLTPNLLMNAQMLEAAYANGVSKFCFISSNTVYPPVEHPVLEDEASYDFFEKYYIVGWMKRFSEIMCEMYSDKIQKPMDVLVVRPGNLYGPFDKFTKSESKVIASLIRKAVEGQNPLEVWGDGHDIKDFLYVDDFVEGMIAAFRSPNITGPVNIASGVEVTIREVIKIILKITENSDGKVSFDASMPSMIPVRRISISKIKSSTGWEPSTDLRSGLEKTINWYKSYYARQSPEDKT